MFISFFLLCRARGLLLTPDQWIMLLSAMEKGLHGSTLGGFYQLCRCLLLKSETEFDLFDEVFSEFFGSLRPEAEIPEEMKSWLEHPADDLERVFEDLRSEDLPDETMEDVLDFLKWRLETQFEEHNGGRLWIGTQGYTPVGNSGNHPGGFRIGGEGMNGTARFVLGERKYRDFRADNVLDIRQFQMAFRRLRQLAVSENEELELDVDGTIRATSDHGGMLHVVERHPRRNNVRVLLLMDAGGSMEEHAALASRLFQAATKANRFKELHTYYFHNCIFGMLYKESTLAYDSIIPTEDVLGQFSPECRVIMVGDARMSPDEFTKTPYNWAIKENGPSGRDWLKYIRQHFPHSIWLNPRPTPTDDSYWTLTHREIARIVPMYQLTSDGLAAGIRRLMARS